MAFRIATNPKKLVSEIATVTNTVNNHYMKLDNKSSKRQGASSLPPGTDPNDAIVQYMLKRNIPFTRKNYRDLVGCEGTPTAEVEADYPPWARVINIPELD